MATITRAIQIIRYIGPPFVNKLTSFIKQTFITSQMEYQSIRSNSMIFLTLSKFIRLFKEIMLMSWIPPALSMPGQAKIFHGNDDREEGRGLL